jgi:hypothetical protein
LGFDGHAPRNHQDQASEGTRVHPGRKLLVNVSFGESIAKPLPRLHAQFSHPFPQWITGGTRK